MESCRTKERTNPIGLVGTNDILYIDLDFINNLWTKDSNLVNFGRRRYFTT